MASRSFAEIFDFSDGHLHRFRVQLPIDARDAHRQDNANDRADHHDLDQGEGSATARWKFPNH